MFWSRRKGADSIRGFMAALAADVRGNTLIIMTAALIPLAGMVGGGIDASRMYILKTRLQHGCDAGALAGRKTMGAGTWSFNNNAARAQAEKFFDANFETGSFGSSGLTRTFTENAGKVSGTASATIPMTLMRIFGKTTDTLTVTCATEMRLPNTDVMFVLDTTGSMADIQPGDSVSKISALKTAVKCFYEIVARLDTNAACTTGVPSGGTGGQVQIRFGFVPYATNVNVGRLLKPEWFANSWKYQTREWIPGSFGGWEYYNYYQTSASACDPPPANTATMQYRLYDESGRPYYHEGNGYCIYYRRAANGGQWRYNQLPVNVGLLKNGTNWNTSFQWPIAAGGTNKTINWEGCIEERQTVRATNYYPIPADAKDLDIDTVPTTGDATSQWGMALNDLIYTRNGGTWDRAESITTADYGNGTYYACPVEAKKLQTWGNADAFDDYVDSLSPEGNTYHDIGLIWGARLASPAGIFGSENALTDRGGEIERHIIFMTDGDACTETDNYTAYGVSWFDRRQTSDSVTPTGGCTYNSATLTEQVNKRTEALCSAIKNHTFQGRQSFTLWVIAFGNLATETETRLSNCATAGRYFKATSASQLQATFKSIADQISQLRLTQ